MILEILESVLTPCSVEAKRFGYRTEVVALGARWRRQSRAWRPHVECARSFIEEAMEQAPAGGRAVVVGSGRLIEVPLTSLSQRFAEVVLADLVHPWPVRTAAWRMGNVRLASVDVSGVLAALRLDAGLPVPPPSGPDIGRFDFAVSCNVLSQLPLLPLAAIGTRTDVAEADRMAFARALLTAHLDWMRRVAPVAALFTDVESLWRDRRTGAEERGDNTWGVALPPPDATWSWTIAPAPEEDPHRDLHHTVQAWKNLNG